MGTSSLQDEVGAVGARLVPGGDAGHHTRGFALGECFPQSPQMASFSFSSSYFYSFSEEGFVEDEHEDEHEAKRKETQRCAKLSVSICTSATTTRINHQPSSLTSQLSEAPSILPNA